MNDLPPLTEKQYRFLMRYFENGNNASEAYRFAYDTSNMQSASIQVEASKMLKNPKVALWLENFHNELQKTITEEIKYTKEDAFRELVELQNASMISSKTYPVAMKAIENKCKLMNLLSDKLEFTAQQVVKMENIKINGSPLQLEVGENIDNGDTDSGNT